MGRGGKQARAFFVFGGDGDDADPDVAQLRSLLAIETGVPRDNMTPVLDYGGMPLTANVVVTAIANHFAEVPA